MGHKTNMKPRGFLPKQKTECVEIQQKVEGEWFTVCTYDELEEAEYELNVLRADSYYARFEFRLRKM